VTYRIPTDPDEIAAIRERFVDEAKHAGAPDVAGRELRLSAVDQQQLFDLYVGEALERAAIQLTDPSLRRVVARAARSRMLANVDTFGDELWFKHPDVLMVDSIEELADAVVYLAARLYRRRNGPGTTAE
jgi:hypothetical protein